MAFFLQNIKEKQEFLSCVLASGAADASEEFGNLAKARLDELLMELSSSFSGINITDATACITYVSNGPFPAETRSKLVTAISSRITSTGPTSPSGPCRSARVHMQKHACLHA